MFPFTNQEGERESDAFDLRLSGTQKADSLRKSLSFSGSNQAREGRLVDALAVRGDEGRDTLR